MKDQLKETEIVFMSNGYIGLLERVRKQGLPNFYERGKSGSVSNDAIVQEFFRMTEKRTPSNTCLGLEQVRIVRM